MIGNKDKLGQRNSIWENCQRWMIPGEKKYVSKTFKMGVTLDTFERVRRVELSAGGK